MNTVGDYISTRLVTFGVEYAFGVVGDTSTSLLDSLGKFSPSIKLVTCCNDASAGYAADGYARKSGHIGTVIVPYLTGSLSIANAVAGAHAGNIPLLVICGGPNSTAAGHNKLMHHTINKNGFGAVTSSQCMAGITAKTFVVHHTGDVAQNVDKAMYTCLKLRKPVYLEIACDLVDKFIAEPVAANQVTYSHMHCDELALEVALCDCMRAVERSNMPVVVVGSEVKSLGLTTRRLIAHFVDRLQAAVVIQPDAKGCFNEESRLFAGSLWGGLSSTHVPAVINEADLVICIGVVLSDASTAGFSSPVLTDRDQLHLHVNSLSVVKSYASAGTKVYTYVSMDRMLMGLAERSPHKEASGLLLRKLKREVETAPTSHSSSLSSGAEPAVDPASMFAGFPGSSGTDRRTDTQSGSTIQQSNTALSQACGSVCAAMPPLLQAGLPSLHLLDVQAGIQRLLDRTDVSSVVAAEGEGWFIGQKLALPRGCDYFMQLQYAACDWAMGASIGISLAASCRQKLVVLIIGDGSFQSALQEISTMVRLNLKVVIFLLNNQQEAIEGSQRSYTKVTNWMYADLINAMQSGGCGPDTDAAHIGVVKGDLQGVLKDPMTCLAKPFSRTP